MNRLEAVAIRHPLRVQLLNAMADGKAVQLADFANALDLPPGFGRPSSDGEGEGDRTEPRPRSFGGCALEFRDLWDPVRGENVRITLTTCN